MQHTADVGIVGGGLAGSLAAAMLGRAGISTVLIDVRHPYPEDFRCEKIEEKHFKILRKSGLNDQIVCHASRFDELWIARAGRLLDRRPNEQYGISYTDLVNRTRDLIPPNVNFIVGKVTKVSTSSTGQTIVLANGDTCTVRLLVLATGNNNNTIREQVGITRRDLSNEHSTSAGFYLVPRGRAAFDFVALTYFGGPKSEIAYISLFPLNGLMRANIFMYHKMRGPFVADLRVNTEQALFYVMPRLHRLLGSFEVPDNKVVIRKIDLYRTEGYRQAGVVLAGDSFSTACPAAGTGVVKALNDVVQLCNHHIPHWLATDGMAVEKINEYYDDPVKVHADEYSEHLAFYMHGVTLGRNVKSRVRRVGWFGLTALEGVSHTIRHHYPAKWSRTDERIREVDPAWSNAERDSDRKYKAIQ